MTPTPATDALPIAYWKQRIAESERPLTECETVSLGQLATLLARIEADKPVVDQLQWLIANSDGVMGLRSDGSVMDWPTVTRMYAPAFAALARYDEVVDPC